MPGTWVRSFDDPLPEPPPRRYGGAPSYPGLGVRAAAVWLPASAFSCEEGGRGDELEAVSPSLPARGFATEEAQRPQAGVGDASAFGLPSRPNERWSLDFVSDSFTD